jgi:[phosphatase 2A protein]-leucine-carboxy methyltransferase
LHSFHAGLNYCVLAGGGTGLRSSKYHLIPADLRAPPSQALGSTLTSIEADEGPVLSPSLPTLIIFECVLAYMSVEASSTLLEWFIGYASSDAGVLGCVIYEMFNLQDSFGKVMVNNLKVSTRLSQFSVIES